MDLRKIKKLIELLEKSNLSEIEIREGESTVRLSRATIDSAHIVNVPSQSPGIVAQPNPQKVAASDDESTGIAVKSPMVGTFFSSADPDSSPFVQVGSTVKPDDTLCILEAMKTFNQVKSEISGMVKAVFKSSGDPVEYGETLFIIEPN